MLNLLNKIYQTASCTTALLSIVIARPAFANNFTQVQYQNHNIPLCGALKKSEYSERTSINTQRFISANESKTIHCFAYYKTLEGTTLTPSRHINNFLRRRAEKYQIFSSEMKGSRKGIIFSHKIRGYEVYGGIIVIDANHLIIFEALGKDKKKVIEAAAYTIENFR